MLGLAVDRKLGIGAAAGLLALILALKPFTERSRRADPLGERGARAEQAVGETLKETPVRGLVLLHDLAPGNIDHIASGSPLNALCGSARRAACLLGCQTAPVGREWFRSVLEG